jgi:hypothetical protein
MNKVDQYKRAMYSTGIILSQRRWHNDDYIQVVDGMSCFSLLFCPCSFLYWFEFNLPIFCRYHFRGMACFYKQNAQSHVC